MKKILFVICIASAALPLYSVNAAETNLAKTLAGRILLQVESYGRAWYVDPVSLERYYLQDGAIAYDIMRTMGLGISDKNLQKIPTARGQRGDAALVNRLRGRILLQVEQRGEAWYVNPVDGVRYYLKDGPAAYELMKKFGLGITTQNLRTVAMNKKQIVHDTTFNDVAYVAYDGETFSSEYNADQVLPLASLTKLMTALVFLDTSPNWGKLVTITQRHIQYPTLLAGDDPTSEIDFAVGDTMTVNDLWAAMLLASSNQAAAALAEASGLSSEKFVAAMNQKAKDLGLTKTIFYDVSGLDSHNITTAKEMAKIAHAAFAVPKIAQVSAQGFFTISATTLDNQPKTIKVADRNYSLQKFSPAASKTGFLVEAQRTVALKKNGHIIVVLHALSMSQRNGIIEKLIQ